MLLWINLEKCFMTLVQSKKNLLMSVRNKKKLILLNCNSFNLIFIRYEKSSTMCLYLEVSKVHANVTDGLILTKEKL